MDDRDELLRGTAEADTMHGMMPPNDTYTQAWSYEHPVFDYPHTGPVPTPSAWGAAGKAVAAAAAVALGATAVIVLTFNRSTTPTVTTTSPPASTSTMTVTAPPADPDVIIPGPPAAQLDPDTQYIRLYERPTNHIVHNDPEAAAEAIALGHAQCDYLAQPGATIDTAITEITDHYVATRQQAHGVVEAAVDAYCPQYRGQL